MAKEKFVPPDPAESMRVIGGVQDQIDDLVSQEGKLKTRTGEVKAALKSLRAKMEATIKGESEENLFTKVAAEAKPAPAGAANPPAGWKKVKLADLALADKDKDALAGAGLKTLADWAAYTKENGTKPPGDLSQAGFKRVEDAVKDVLSGKTQPAQQQDAAK